MLHKRSIVRIFEEALGQDVVAIPEAKRDGLAYRIELQVLTNYREWAQQYLPPAWSIIAQHRITREIKRVRRTLRNLNGAA